MAGFFAPKPDVEVPFFRPIPVVTGAVDFVFWGVRPLGYHLTNLLIHLLTSLLVGVVAARFSRSRYAGPLATLAYGLYPGNVESVAWAVQRMAELAVLFVWLALSLHPHRRLRPLAWAWAAGLAGLLCKETANLLPVAILLHDWLLQRRAMRAVAAAAVSGRDRDALEKNQPDYPNAGPDRLASGDDHACGASMARRDGYRRGRLRLQGGLGRA